MNRCNFIWLRSNGQWVQCLNNLNHGHRHEMGLSYVAVGQEIQVQHYWTDEK